MTTRLYDIPKEIENFEHRLIENDGELTPELEQAWTEFVTGSKERLEAAAFVIKRLKGDAEICRDEVKRLEARARSMENNGKRLSGLALYALKAMGGKVKTALISLSVGRTGEQLAVEMKEGTDLVEIEKSHPEFVRVKREMNLEAIKEAYGAITKQLVQEQEAEFLTAGDNITQEQHDQIIAKMLARREELLKAANLPTCFIVRHQAGTEYLRIK